MTATEPGPTAGPPFGATPWPLPAPPTPPRRPSAGRWIAVGVAALAIFAGSALAGRGLESNWNTGSTSGTSASGSFSFGSGSGSSGSGSGSSSSGSNGPSSTRSVNIDSDAIAAKANPAIVNIQTTLDGGEAAGTGMVISKTGLVLTNNHVIENATDLKAEIGVTGKTYDAEVVGYDVADDVALVQLQGVSDMKTIAIGDASTVDSNEPVVAIGNAQGKFGTPSVVSGLVSDIGKTITAGDSAAETETLHDMIEIQANIQPGDSGGPLLDANGEVIGMNTAADVGGSQFGFQQSGTTGFAIPINKALTIVKEIQSGDTSNGAHIGGHKAMLGVALDSSGSSADNSGGFGNQFGGGSDSSNGSDQSGAVISQVQSGSAADSAGIQQGDTIVGLDGHSVSSADALRTALETKNPGDSVRIDWVDSSGDSHHATVKLDSGPPA